ncbi:hypothetical protein MOQ72_06215 [Saccharopolyspora sp. K220]|uniref:hypothetical protein n=1 Tax=Saccharopolyspora soli TaxID=2926618 RepID=UPI001F570590|nr:hypothetical protein [Saccharopolyspora soli]MCI2417012.1 hypothetical protein [Saccharopolyspora soli]
MTRRTTHAELPEWVRTLLSESRFDRYLKAAGGEIDVAVRLYDWNVEVSAAFFGPLHWLEVSLRNALNHRLRHRYGQDDWWSAAPLTDNGRLKVSRARRKLGQQKVGQFSPDDVVAELTFGFWVSLLSRVHDRMFWVPVLHKSFPNYAGSRHALHGDFMGMLDFRNRVMHHEPIFYLDLPEYHQRIYRLLGYLSPDAAEHAGRTDLITDVLERRDEVWPRMG